jgi:hypothetical protein
MGEAECIRNDSRGVRLKKGAAILFSGQVFKSVFEVTA